MMAGAEGEAPVVAGEDHLGGVVEQAGLLEDRLQRRARPLVDAERLAEPGDVDRARVLERAARARALHDRRLLDARARLDLVERERPGVGDPAADRDRI